MMTDLSSYRKVNEAFRKRLIYHVGKDCGFFVELNYMLNAMLYCLAHRLQFQLYSEDANFGTGKGWTEYFLPFCPEVHEPFHRKYNFHRPPTWRRIIRNAVRSRNPRLLFWKPKTMLKTVVGRILGFHAYGEWVLLGQDVAFEPDRHYNIPELGIDGDYYHAYSLLARMIWKMQPNLCRQESDIKQFLHLPPHYSGMQIRGGDKATEALLIDGRKMVEALSPADGDAIFVLTDDIRLLHQAQARFPKLHFLSLCQADDTGYNQQAFSNSDPLKKKEAVTRLLISVDILLGSQSFAGSITTGPSVFLMKTRADDPLVNAVDCPHEALKSVLTLTIDQRAAISQQHIREHHQTNRLLGYLSVVRRYLYDNQ